MKKVTDYLQELGLTEIEALLYEGLLETGPTTVMDLSEHTGIKRITTHFNIESLIKKGLVIQSIKGSRRQIIPEEPRYLYYLVEKKEYDIKNLKQGYSEILNMLQKTARTQQSKGTMEIKYYQGKKQLQRLYDETSKTKKLWSIVNIDEVLSTFPENERKFSDSIKKGLKMWEILDKDSEKHTYLQTLNTNYYHSKRLPKNTHVSKMDFMLFKNTVALIDYKQHEPLGVSITNPTLFEGLKSIFDLLWNLLS